MRLLFYIAVLCVSAFYIDLESQSVLYAVICPMLAGIFALVVFIKAAAMTASDSKTASGSKSSSGGSNGVFFGGSDGGCGGDSGGGGDGGC